MGFGRALVVDGEFDKNFQLSRPQPVRHVSLLPVAGLNVYDIMRSDKLVLTTAARQSDRGAPRHEHAPITTSFFRR